MDTKQCLVEGCARPPTQNSGKACGMHAQRKRRTGDYGPAGPLKMHGMDRRQLKPPTFCTIEGCEKKHKARGYCVMHYWRLRTKGELGSPNPSRRAQGTGGLNQGYVIIKVDGKATSQHRHVMEQMIGRTLLPGENVHHINGDRADNRPENLELWSTNQPPGQRVADKVAWAVELLRLYAPDELRQPAVILNDSTYSVLRVAS